MLHRAKHVFQVSIQYVQRSLKKVSNVCKVQFQNSKWLPVSHLGLDQQTVHTRSVPSAPNIIPSFVCVTRTVSEKNYLTLERMQFTSSKWPPVGHLGSDEQTVRTRSMLHCAKHVCQVSNQYVKRSLKKSV